MSWFSRLFKKKKPQASRQNNPYPFKQDKDIICYTCNHVLDDGDPILYASHERYDQSWVFLCGREGHDMDRSRILELQQMAAHDGTLGGLRELAVGQNAQRKNVNSEWTFYNTRVVVDNKNDRLAFYHQIITAQDGEAVEEARDYVQAEDLPALTGMYKNAKDWGAKCTVIEILTDQNDEILNEIMLDFLRAPRSLEDDNIAWGKAVAMGFQGEEYESFSRYYDNRALLDQDLRKVLASHGLALDELEADQERDERHAPPADLHQQDVDLITAVNEGEVSLVKKALARGEKIDQQETEMPLVGMTPLMLAAHHGYLGVVEHLIAEGADVNFKRPDQHRPDETRGQTALWWAADLGSLPMVEILIKSGADVNTPDHHGSTPLHRAAAEGHLDCLQLLVNRGADINALGSMNRRPINLAAQSGQAATIAALLDAGADIESVGDSGYTPLMIAVQDGYLDVVQLLIDRGADVNAVFNAGEWYIAMHAYTPLAFGVRAGKVRVVKALLAAGADRNYVVPARVNHHGEQLPAATMASLVGGKRPDSILKLLVE